MPLQIIKLASLLVATVISTGCAQTIGGVQDRYDYPSSLSMIWDDGATTFVIPKKGVMLVRTVRADTTIQPMGEIGSYLTVTGVYRTLVFSDQDGNQIPVQRR